MNARFDVRSLVVGGVAVGVVILMAGGVGGDPLPETGRYHVACTQMTCYLVDSMTGQVWREHDGWFNYPKISIKADRSTDVAKEYLGQWSGRDPDQTEELSIHFKPDGLLHATDSDSRDGFEGRWWIVGDWITLSFEDDTLIGQISGDGQLILGRGYRDNRFTLQRAKRN